jgi:hypothetical protein
MTPQKPTNINLSQSAAPVNLIISTSQMQSAATIDFQPPAFGVPIMREGFITETGLLQGSPDD